MLYCLFLSNTIPIFDKINTVLQYEKPMIHRLKKELFESLCDIYVRFLKPSAINSAKSILRWNILPEEIREIGKT